MEEHSTMGSKVCLERISFSITDTGEQGART